MGKIPRMIDSWFAKTSAKKLQNSLKSVVFLFNLNIEGHNYNVIKRIKRSLLRMTINATAQSTLRPSHEKTCFYI